MAEPSWPPADRRRLIGRPLSRLDAVAKVTGAATYAYDVNRPGMLHAKVLRSPVAHAKVTRIDVEPARRVPGVKAVRVIQGAGSLVQWALDEIAVVAAVSEQVAEDAVRAIVVEYALLPHFVSDEDLAHAPVVKPTQQFRTGDFEVAIANAQVKVEGYYGLPAVAHCCLEPHGQVCEWDADGRLTAWCSTQSVSALPQQFAEVLDVPASKVRVLAPYVGGGFGSKFGPDRWGIECAQLARDAKAPVKLMLERDAELAVAGDRPSAYARVLVGALSDGTLTAWSSKSWGSGGLPGSGSPPLPYVIEPSTRRQEHVAIVTQRPGARAWRAPNHPQACFITMAALDDTAAALAMDPIDFLRWNLPLTGSRGKNYEAELRVAAELSKWKERWHPRGKGAATGALRRGLGVSLHAWGGRGHQSACEVTIHPDGSALARIGSQDIGTGTRTVVAIVLAETLGLPLSAVSVEIGDSALPPSGPSGGSTTVGGVSASTRRAALAALGQLHAHVAPKLRVETSDLEAVDGRIRSSSNPASSMSWRDAAALLGVTPITAIGRNPGSGELTTGGVGGVQVAEVEVDVETGVVRVVRMVAVQDCGLVIDAKTARSQVLGGLIMGIGYALFEEKILDPITGRMLNADMEHYKLPGIADVGELVVHLMTGPEHDARGVIGLGEPPVISPGAAISNAVANAIGVRVPYLPITPDRVLTALAAPPGTLPAAAAQASAKRPG